MRNRDGMQINHANECVVAVLKIHPVADRSKPITEVQSAGRLHPGKNPRPPH